MLIVIEPSELRRKRTHNEPAQGTYRTMITAQLSFLLDILWKPWEELGEVDAAWVEVRFSDEGAWLRAGPFPLYFIAIACEDEHEEGATEG